MLVILGFAMILTFMVLIMTKRLTPMVALIIVPTVFGLFAGAGLGLGDMVIEAIGVLASDRRPVDVRDHVLRDHDRRRALRPARPVHRPCARQRPGEDRRRHGSPRRGGVTRRRRLDDLHRDDRRHAADLPAARHEPGRPHLRRRARERHAQHRPVGRPDRPRRLGPGVSPTESSSRCCRRSPPAWSSSSSSPGSWGSGSASASRRVDLLWADGLASGGARRAPAFGFRTRRSPAHRRMSTTFSTSRPWGRLATLVRPDDTAMADTTLDPERDTLRPRSSGSTSCSRSRS